MAVKRTFIATGLAGDSRFADAACAGASQPEATGGCRRARRRNRCPGSYPRIVITGTALRRDPANEAYLSARRRRRPWAFMQLIYVLKDTKPDIGRITSDFINKDYRVNMESLMNPRPGIIYYYGKSQDDRLERAGERRSI